MITQLQLIIIIIIILITFSQACNIILFCSNIKVARHQMLLLLHSSSRRSHHRQTEVVPLCNSVHCCLWLFCKERNLATSIDYVCSYLHSPFLLEVGLDCWCESKATRCSVSNSHAPLHCLVQIFLLTPQQLSVLNSLNYNRRSDSTLIALQSSRIAPAFRASLIFVCSHQ